MPRYIFDPNDNIVSEAETDEQFNDFLNTNPGTRAATESEIAAAFANQSAAEIETLNDSLRPAEEDKKTVIEKVAESIPESATAFLESYGRTYAPILYQEFEKLVGVPQEEQLRRSEEYPIETAAAVPFGIVGSLATGTKLLGALSPVVSGAAAVRTGIQSIANAALPVQAATAAGKTALSVGKIAADATAAGVEAAALAGMIKADELMLRDEPITPEAVLHSAVSGFGIGAILGGGVRAYKQFATTGWGKKHEAWLETNVAKKVLEHFDASEADIRRFERQTSRGYETRLLNDAVDYGLVAPGMFLRTSLQRAEDLMQKSGQAIGKFVDEADARVIAAGGKKSPIAPSIDELIETISDKVVSPLAKDTESLKEAELIASRLDTYKRFFDQPKQPLKASDLFNIRKGLDNTIYGLRSTKDPLRTREIQALRDMRRIINDELIASFKKAGIDPSVYDIPRKQYAAAARIEALADAAIQKEMALPASEKYLKASLKMIANVPAFVAKSPTYLAVGNDWVYHGLRSAIRDKAPQPVIDAMQTFAARRSSGLLDEASRLGALSTEDQQLFANVEQGKILTLLSDAKDEISKNGHKYPDEYRLAVLNAYKSLQRSIAQKHVPAKVADNLESIENKMTQLSRLPSQKPELLDEAVGMTRFIRDSIRSSLAQGNIWGTARQQAAVQRLRQSAEAIRGSDRRVALESLKQLSDELLLDVNKKSNMLMNTALKPALKQTIKVRAIPAYEQIQESLSVPSEEEEP